MPALTDFDVLSFDCYGTLIDWETGIITALQPLIARTGRHMAPDEILTAFSRNENTQQSATPDCRYPDILKRVHAAISEDWAVAPDAGLAAEFGDSVGAWPAFPDSMEALNYLKQHYKLVILSNVDRASFAGSNARLGVTFDAIYTAQDVGSYKPTPGNFVYMLEHLAMDFGIGRHRVLHTAESLFHDHAPATRFGLAKAWIHRRVDKGGFGATKEVADRPEVDFYFKSMAEMVDAHRAAVAG